VAPVDLSRASEEDLDEHPSASWAEAGMPLRLRDAIASVRRVSHELYQGAPPDHEPLPATPRPDHGDADLIWETEPASDYSTWDDGPADPDHPPADGGDQQANRFDGPTNEMAFHQDVPGDEWPPARIGLQEEFERAFQREQIELEDGAAREELELGNGGVRKSDGAAPTLHDGHQEPTRDDATHGEPHPDDDDVDEDSSARPGEELHDRPPARRRPTAGYGVHVTALAAAIVFVALAGFGFGMLSDSAPPQGSAPGQDMATAAPAPATAALSAPPTVPPLDEVVRVAPPPGDALAEPASVAPARATVPARAEGPLRAIPLPPPPKPDLPQAATDQAPRDNQPGNTTVDAAIVPAGAEETADQAVSAAPDGEGTGGPFEPLFAKVPAQASGGQVLVQYMADAAGGPATAMHVVRQLQAAGFAVEARGVPFSIRANSIRYFFPEDRERAEALRASLEGQLPGDAAPAVMDFSSFEPKPQEGHLEVWLRS
jgi:hypothetical protein